MSDRRTSSKSSFLKGHKITREIVNEVIKRFHDVHQSIYQHCLPANPVEFVAFRTVYRQEAEPKIRLELITATSGGKVAIKSHRRTYFDEYKGFIDTPIYERSELKAGQVLEAPAIVEQADTTTVVYPGQTATVDQWGNLIMAGV